MTDIYKYWDTQQAFSGWENARTWDKRFRSEKYFLERIFKPGMSVLDIGCATGDLHLGLLERFGDHTYVGTDTSKVMIEGAKKMCPDCRFYEGDIVQENLVGDEKFDIVTATGVFQHEPQFEKLLLKMLEHTKEGGYVLFDCKFFYDHESIVDITRSYCDLPDKLYFNVLNFEDALAWLKKIENISSIEIFGYYSGTHSSVRLPLSVQEEVCSAHVLLKKNSSPTNPEINFNLPDIFK